MYDDENQLIQYRYEPPAPGLKTDFVYDAKLRLRIRREYTGTPGSWTLQSETRYLYDGMRVIQERNVSNVPQVTHIRGLDLSGSLEGACGIGGLLGSTAHSGAAGTTYAHAFYHADRVGNITCLLNSDNSLGATYKYDPFGRTLSSSGALASANVLRFSSKELCSTSSLYYYGYRFYDPLTQQWPNRDPLGELGFTTLKRPNTLPLFASHRYNRLVSRAFTRLLIGDGANSYRFLNNNPIDRRDSDGLRVFSIPVVFGCPTFEPGIILCQQTVPIYLVKCQPVNLLICLEGFQAAMGLGCVLADEELFNEECTGLNICFRAF